MGELRRTWPAFAVVILISAGCSFPSPPASSSPSAAPSTYTAVVPPADTPTPTTPAAQSPTATLAPVIERVLIISLDGLRGDAVTPESMPTVWSLASVGAATLTAQTILPSSTLPAHGSMLSGFDVDAHGLTWNDYIPANGYIRTPTIFSLAHQAGLRTVMVVGKEKLEHIAIPGSVDHFDYIAGGDFQIAEAAAIEMANGFGVMFVHFVGPDAAGHLYGWLSSSYFGTIANTDEAVRRVLASLDENGLRGTTLVIVTADHGGHGTTHGSDRPEDMTIPWIAAGPGVVPGRTLTGPVRVFDTMATAAWALGLEAAPGQVGQPVLEAFAP